MAEEIRTRNRWLLLPLLAALLAVRPAAAPSPPATISADAPPHVGQALELACLPDAAIGLDRAVTASAQELHREADEATCASVPAVGAVGPSPVRPVSHPAAASRSAR